MIKWINKKRNKKGFTLVELVVVIAILGVLAAVAVPKLTASRTSAANSAHNANVRTLEGAASMYMAEVGIPTSNVDWTGKKDEGWETYLQDWPTVPNGAKFPANAEEAYTVGIDDKGTIKVLPVAIKLDKEKVKES